MIIPFNVSKAVKKRKRPSQRSPNSEVIIFSPSLSTTQKMINKVNSIGKDLKFSAEQRSKENKLSLAKSLINITKILPTSEKRK